jgi:hypothetical protein
MQVGLIFLRLLCLSTQTHMTYGMFADTEKAKRRRCNPKAVQESS